VTQRRIERRMGTQVPMGGIAVAEAPDLLQIRGLGSCIALALYDPTTGIGGLAHTVLPRTLRRDLPGPAWASPLALERLVKAMVERGAHEEALRAHLAGGASMIQAARAVLNVGAENARVVLQSLRDTGIPILSRDLGGTHSRNVTLDPATGEFRVEGGNFLAERPPVPLPPTQQEEDQAFASIVLYRAAYPLSLMLSASVEVEEPSAYDLAPQELTEFLGGPGAHLYWSVIPLEAPVIRGERAPSHLVLLLPRYHAHRLARAVAERSGVEAEPHEVLPELFNQVSGHVATALAIVARRRLIPGLVVLEEGSALAAVRAVRAMAPPSQPLYTLHGRLHAEGVLHGADLAFVLVGFPGAPREDPFIT